MDDFSIFMESNEDMGLLFNSYKDIGSTVDTFLKMIEGKIDSLTRDPKGTDADLREEITKFKEAVNKKFTPSPINIGKIDATKSAVRSYRTSMEKILDRYAKARNKMSFGGNLMRAIIRKPKVYSKEIDSESYAKNNRNIRNIGRALDWVEKVMIDLFNLIDQDLNILTIVGKVYGKRKIYEHTEIFQSGDFDEYKDFYNPGNSDDLLDEPIEDVEEGTIGEFKNGILRIPVSNTKYKARVEQLIRRYHAPVDSGNIILVIRGREDFINAIMSDCGYNRKEAEKEFDVYKLHGYIHTDNPLQVNITERKHAVGGFNQTYEMLVLHECTHSVVNSIPQAHVLTSNFQEGIAIYESGMLKHMLEKFNKSPSMGRRKYYPPLLRSTLQVRNIIREKGYDYLVKIIKGSIREPSYDEFINESGQLDMFTEAPDDSPPNMPNEGDENNEQTDSNSEGSGEAPQTSDVPPEDSELYEEPEEQPKEEVKKESIPKKTDAAESSKNGVRRKKLYVAFIEWAKEYNPKNTFGSIFDKDIFHNVYPFVPDEMRYFYRLANPILCVLGGDLTFFQVSELKRLNASNKEMNKLLIFAATPNDLRVFNKEDKRIYIGTDKDGAIELGESIGDTFDLYIQKMIKKGNILNGPTEESEE